MRVLFVGGTGIISSACTRLLSEHGVDLTLLSRGQSTRDIPKSVRILRADIRQPSSVRDALAGQRFDAVVDWIAFTPEHQRKSSRTMTPNRHGGWSMRNSTPWSSRS